MKYTATLKNLHIKSYYAVVFVLLVSVMSNALSSFIPSVAHAENKGVQDLSTGQNTACVVVDDWVKCWGSNQYGQLGTGRTDTGAIQSTPQTVIKTGNPMSGKYVEKVSVGTTHACALANATVFCWGDNSHGQLGNRTNTTSSSPVAVDVADRAITPAPTYPNPCGGWFQPSCTPTTYPTRPKSGLGQKEVIDIAAGDKFTCALASDGTVACWGEGDNGRLGVNSTTDYNYPQTVFNQSGSALSGKKGVQLAKASGSSMCVLAVQDGQNAGTGSGMPYCWGYGIGTGSIPASNSSNTACSKTSPTSVPAGTSNTVYFDSLQPVQISGTQVFTALDGNDYITGLGSNSRPYYWGMNGYRNDATYSNVTSCSINPCTADAGNRVTLAAAQRSVSKTTRGTGGSYSSTQRGGSYSGVARPNTGGSSSPQRGGGGGNSCASVIHYGYTKNAIYIPVGQKAPTSPIATSLNQSSISTLSGNVFAGLFCATNTSGTYCDTNGTSASEGQTGSTYTPSCVTSGYLWYSSTTCTPAPSGPQKVTTSEWLAGKTVESLSTGTSGYNCAVASGSVGCWGYNGQGQLGTGDTNNRNVPVAVKL